MLINSESTQVSYKMFTIKIFTFCAFIDFIQLWDFFSTLRGPSQFFKTPNLHKPYI